MKPTMKSAMTAVLALSLGVLAGCDSTTPPFDLAAPTSTAQAADSDHAGTGPSATATLTAASPAVGHASDADAATAIPASADATWRAIDGKLDELRAIIAHGDLKQVHHVAFAIRDLVAALPAQGRALPADDQARLSNGAKFVATLADRLDASGDGNDRVGAQANLEKLEVILRGLPRGK